MTKDYTSPIRRALLEPNNNDGCIMRSAPIGVDYTGAIRVKMGNLSVSYMQLFGCLAISPFAEMIFDAGRMEDSPLRAKKRYDNNYDYNQIAIRRVTPFDSEMTEDGSIEVSGELEILINSGQTRRNDPFPNGMEIANRSASRVGEEKVDDMVWDYAERFRFRIVYEVPEKHSDSISDASEWENMAVNVDIDRDTLPEQLTNTRRFGTTRSRHESEVVDGHRRTLHEPSSVAVILHTILNHQTYSAIQPHYRVTHSVNECLIQMKAENVSRDTIEQGYYISMALMPSRLPIPNGPFEGLEVMGPIDYDPKLGRNITSEMVPSFNATRKIVAPDMSHWIGPHQSTFYKSAPGTLDIQFVQNEAIFNFEIVNIDDESLVSLTDKDDSLLGFARINERGHAFLCIPFELEFTVHNRLINIRKGDYRIRIIETEDSIYLGITHCISLYAIHSQIILDLGTITFNPVSDRVKSMSRITNSTDETPIKQTQINHRLSKRTTNLTDDNILGSRNID